MFRKLKCAIVFVTLCAIYVLPFPALEAAIPSPALTPVEEREILAALEELKATRAEIAKLQALVKADQETITALQGQTGALEALTSAQDRGIRALDKVIATQGQMVESYKALVATAQEQTQRERVRADAAEARADTWQRWAVYGTVGGFLVGLVAGTLIIAW